MTDQKKLHEYKHPYYGSYGCFFTPGYQFDEVHAEWNSWQEFYDAWGDNDPDLNLLYRWDWNRSDPDDYQYELEDDPDFEIPGDYLDLFFMLQRKAKPFSHVIQVTEDDEPAIREFLTERAKTIRQIWEPILND